MVGEGQAAPEDQQRAEQQEEEYVDFNEVAEEVPDDDGDYVVSDEENDMDTDGHGGDDTIEIDLSNNSWSYFDQHKDSVFTVFKHPTLPMVVSGGGDNTAYLWTTHTQPPRFVGELQGHKESVITGGFTGDGRFCVTGDMNGLIQVFKSLKGGQKWLKFADLEEVEEVLWTVVHPRLPYFAFGGVDGSVWCFQIDEDSKSLVQIMSGFSHSLECNGGAFINTDDDERLLLVTISEDGTVVCWNCFTGETTYKLLPHDEFKGVESPWVSIKPYNNLVAIGGRDGQLAIINNDTGRVIHSVRTLENTDDEAELSVEAIDWCTAPLLNILTVGLVSGDVLLFETQQWRLRKSIKVDDALTKLQFIEGSPLLLGSSMNGRIYEWDTRTGDEVFVGLGHNMGILDFTVLEGGKKIVTAGDEGVSLIFSPPN